MKSLVIQLQEQGLLPQEIELSLLTIEEWLLEHYPIMAVLYRQKVLKAVIQEISKTDLDKARFAA